MSRITTRNLAVLFFLIIAIQPAFSASFSAIRLDPRAAPQGFENGRRYDIAYLASKGDQIVPVDPDPEEKKANADLILASIVRELMNREFAEKGSKAEVIQVQPASASEILTLTTVTKAPGIPAWSPENQATLATWLENGKDSLELYLMFVRVETPGFVLEQTVPLIIRPKVCPGQRDMLTLFFVTTQKVVP